MNRYILSCRVLSLTGAVAMIVSCSAHDGLDDRNLKEAALQKGLSFCDAMKPDSPGLSGTPGGMEAETRQRIAKLRDRLGGHCELGPFTWLPGADRGGPPWSREQGMLTITSHGEPVIYLDLELAKPCTRKHEATCFSNVIITKYRFPDKPD